MSLCSSNLAEFVKKTDEIGGPGTPACNEFWAGLEYIPNFELDRQLDPLSSDYRQQQMDLYAEITGKQYTGMNDEFTPNVPVDRLLHAPNAYDHPSPAEFAKHCVAVGMLVQKLNLSRGAKILELGSGWGMCQEFLANCGFETVGIDANSDFVDASNNRLERLGFGRRVQQCGFDDVDVAQFGKFDAVIAYEAFHHAVDALDLMERSVACLEDDGIFALAAEPFNNYYATWGLRRDPYSIYCIKKFGWFESGWSASYMSYLFGLCGLNASFEDLPVSDLTRYMYGRRSVKRSTDQLGLWHPDVHGSVFADGNGLFCKAHSKLLVPAPLSCVRIELDLVNYGPRALAVQLRLLDTMVNVMIPPGNQCVPLTVPARSVAERELVLYIDSDIFCPAEEGINEDRRELGVYLAGLNVY